MPQPQDQPMQSQRCLRRCAPRYPPTGETMTAAATTTTRNLLWLLPWTRMMNRWQQPPHEDVGAKAKKKKNTNKKEKDDEGKKKKKKNTCPHCKKLGRKRPHPKTPHNKCFWNKSYKGWRPRLICDELEIDFKPRSKFSANLGGWPEADE